MRRPLHRVVPLALAGAVGLTLHVALFTSAAHVPLLEAPSRPVEAAPAPASLRATGGLVAPARTPVGASEVPGTGPAEARAGASRNVEGVVLDAAGHGVRGACV